MADLVEGDWDQVHVFAMDILLEEGVEEDIGQLLDMPDYYLGHGSVLVFLSQGRVLRAVESYKVFLHPRVFDR
ncbi:hypothetical protein L6E12_11225 [Actinokineospora sp. PR83]|uniref:hypothetical protein n=1 Tax=Actinokineospora sp. PR83 TaxID=2884908 RepID=UPI001F351A5E|nr:hypothetical protein [Actinokineospora sp. PR83]MCG8916361.1 hypothetical protein [Actinokineospora sp. PR83]